jgi:hypothetical protein
MKNLSFSVPISFAQNALLWPIKKRVQVIAIQRIRLAVLSLAFFLFYASTSFSQTVCGLVDLSCFTNTDDPSAIRCVNGNLTILELTTVPGLIQSFCPKI